MPGVADGRLAAGADPPSGPEKTGVASGAGTGGVGADRTLTRSGAGTGAGRVTVTALGGVLPLGGP
jgi:hypothetical protein